MLNIFTNLVTNQLNVVGYKKERKRFLKYVEKKKLKYENIVTLFKAYKTVLLFFMTFGSFLCFVYCCRSFKLLKYKTSSL